MEKIPKGEKTTFWDIAKMIGVWIVIGLLVNMMFQAASAPPKPTRAELETLENAKKLIAGFGLEGKLYLYRLKSDESYTGRLHGSFFLGCGDVNGSLGMEQKVKFAIRTTNGAILICQIPVTALWIDVVDFPIPATVTIDWNYHEVWMSQFSWHTDNVCSKAAEFINSANTNSIHLQISKEDMKNEVMFPLFGD